MTSQPKFWNSLRSTLRCYIKLQITNIQGDWSHTKSAWLEHGIFFMDRLLGLFALYFIFQKARSIGDWNIAEITFLYGMWLLAPAFYRLLFQGVAETHSLVNHGTMDLILTKPRSPLFLIFSRKSNTTGIFDIAAGVTLIIYAGVKAHLAWGFATILILAYFIICANLITVAIMMSQATFAFWLNRFTVIYDIIMSIRELGRYPLTIYHSAIRVFLSVAVPIAFCSYVPASILLKKDGFSEAWIIAPLIVAIISLYLSVKLFEAGLKRYQGTGN
jgi:ABC-2 type transport system permease protein